MVIGPGRWGSFIAWYLKKIGHEVLLYGLNGTEDFENFKKSRTNGIITLQDDLELTDDITRAKECEVIHVSINAEGFRSCLLYTSPSPRDAHESRMPSSA